jgi:hypothetical protein
MRNLDFFLEIEHRQVPWDERVIYVPVFYFDTMRLDALFMAPAEKLKALLPSPRLHPLRITPWSSAIAISAMEFRDSDIGPYNEVSISIPITLDKPSPLFTGILRKGSPEPYVYIHHLPVTTEIARDAGVEFAGYPKFLAQIEFEKQDDWVTCHLAEEGRHILTLGVRQLGLNKTHRSRIHYITTRGGRILRSCGVSNERLQSSSRDASHMRLELGDHSIAQELKELGLGRMLACTYVPSSQSILSPALESFAM